jgi:hypothetical protein
MSATTASSDRAHPLLPLDRQCPQSRTTATPLVSRRPRFHRPSTCAVHHLALSAAASQSQSLLLLVALPTTRSALQWPSELPPRTPLTACHAASPSALQDRVGSPRAVPTPSHRPASSCQSALKPVLATTSSTATVRARLNVDEFPIVATLLPEPRAGHHNHRMTPSPAHLPTQHAQP